LFSENYLTNVDTIQTHFFKEQIRKIFSFKRKDFNLNKDKEKKNKNKDVEKKRKKGKRDK